MQIKYLTNLIIIVCVSFVLAHPLLAHAVSQEGISNPLGDTMTISEVLTNIIKWMLGLVGFLALIALIIGGGRMVMDFGNEEQVKKGKATVLWAVIGLAVVILSYAILNIVTSEVLGAGGSQTQSGQ